MASYSWAAYSAGVLPVMGMILVSALVGFICAIFAALWVDGRLWSNTTQDNVIFGIAIGFWIATLVSAILSFSAPYFHVFLPSAEWVVISSFPILLGLSLGFHLPFKFLDS